MNAKMILRALWKWARRNSTKILAAGAITSEIAGFYFMHKEAPIVRDRLNGLPEDAKWTDKVRVALPVYLPAIGMFLLSSGCTIGTCAAGEHKAASWACLYSASEACSRRIEQKIIDEIGPEKATELHKKAVEELANENPPVPTDIKITGKGDKLFFERRTGQWFYSSYPAVLTDEATFNGFLNEKCGAGLDFNEWLDCLGAERAAFGDYWGFNCDHKLKLIITSDHKMEDGTQYYIIDYLDDYGYGPVMYNGKRGLEFRRSEDCYPEDYSY